MKKLILFVLVVGALYFIISHTPDRSTQVSKSIPVAPRLIFGPVNINTSTTPQQLLVAGNQDQTVVAWATSTSSTMSVAYLDEMGQLDKQINFDTKSQPIDLSALAVDPSGIAMITWFKKEMRPLTIAGIKQTTSSQQLMKAVVSKYGSVLDTGTVVDEAVDTSGLKKPYWSAIRLRPSIGFEINWYNSQTYKLDNGSLVPSSWAPLSLLPINKKPPVVKEVGNWKIYQGNPVILKQTFTVSGEPYGPLIKVPVGFKPKASLPFSPLRQTDALQVDGQGNIYSLGRLPDGKLKKTPNGFVLPQKLWLSKLNNNGKPIIKAKLVAKASIKEADSNSYATILTANDSMAAVIWSTITEDWQFLTFGQLFNAQGRNLTDIPILFSVDKKIQAALTDNGVLVIASSSKIDLGLSFQQKRKRQQFLRIPGAATGVIKTTNNSLLLAWPSDKAINVTRWQLDN